jgi:hypothetical protein
MVSICLLEEKRYWKVRTEIVLAKAAAGEHEISDVLAESVLYRALNGALRSTLNAKRVSRAAFCLQPFVRELLNR